MEIVYIVSTIVRKLEGHEIQQPIDAFKTLADCVNFCTSEYFLDEAYMSSETNNISWLIASELGLFKIELFFIKEM